MRVYPDGRNGLFLAKVEIYVILIGQKVWWSKQLKTYKKQALSLV